METIEANGLQVIDVLQRGRNARTGAKESQVSLLLASRSGGGPCARERCHPPIVDHRRVQQAVRRQYARLASFPTRSHHLPAGRRQALALGYPETDLQGIPATAIAAFCGVACNVARPANPGEVVVDVGAGGGMDALLFARAVGANGQVVGVEMTEEMLRLSLQAARKAGAANLRLLKGVAEDLPLPDSYADAVYANGVVNLHVPDKPCALAEAWRVLKPGGRLVLGDVVVDAAADWRERSIPERWASGLAGSLPEAELLALVGEAGFADPRVIVRSAPLVRVDQASGAETVGALGVLLEARKA
ncbi:MAG: methyltransferase domain-containing protein [Chloroflexota bacterium]